jgi:hypothetical protein
VPNPGAAVVRLRGWRGQTVTIGAHVNGLMPSQDRRTSKPFANQSGPVLALNACAPDCARPDLHDEIGVQLDGRIFWFRASELIRETGLIGRGSPRSPARAEGVA